MWKLFKWSCRLTITLLGILFFRCGSGDAKKKGTITFHGLQFNAGEFTELNEQFGKTSTTAYYKSKAFSHADVASFTALDEHYAKDKDTVYYCDEYREGQNYYLTKKQTLLTVQYANPLTFASLQHGYARDRQHVYFEGTSFQVKDPATFTAIDTHFAKDTIQAYLNRKPIAGSDGSTFHLAGDHFAKDKNHLYYYGYTGEGDHNIVVLPGDPEAFVIIDYRYSKNKTNVYFLGFKIKEADPLSFMLLDEGYAKDKRFVYYEQHRVNGADVSSFEVYKENGEQGHDVCYARDITSVFMNERKVAHADAHSFQVLGENYGRDNRNVYYKTNIVKKAQTESFKVFPHTIGDADAEDGKNKFYEGQLVQDN